MTTCKWRWAQTEAGKASLRKSDQRYRQTEGGRAGRRKRGRKYKQSALGKAAARRYRVRNPEKLAAHRAVHVAIRNGSLVRPSICEHCGIKPEPRRNDSSGIEASHTDYSRQLDVEWLCAPCHRTKDRSR